MLDTVPVFAFQPTKRSNMFPAMLGSAQLAVVEVIDVAPVGVVPPWTTFPNGIVDTSDAPMAGGERSPRWKYPNWCNIDNFDYSKLGAPQHSGEHVTPL